MTRGFTVVLASPEPNDPVKRAAASPKVLDSDRPPPRLVLGGDAVDGLREHHEAMLAEVAARQETGRTTAIA